MTQTRIIANRIREVLLSGTWTANTNYQHQRSNVCWQQVTQQVGDLNTIAASTPMSLLSLPSLFPSPFFSKLPWLIACSTIEAE